MKSDSALIVVPGVGDQAPGEVLDNLEKAGVVGGTRTTEEIGGAPVPVLDRPANLPFSRVYELNWSDLSPPTRSFLDAPRYLLSLFFVLLRCAARPAQVQGGRTFFPRLYRIWFEMVFVWTMQLPLLLIIYDILDVRFKEGIVLGAILLIFFFRLFQVSRNSTPLAWGTVIWTILFGVFLYSADKHWVVPVATQIYVAGLVGTVALCWLASLEAILNRRAAKVRNGRATWLAMMHIPFVVVSSLYAFIMGCILNLVRPRRFVVGSVIDNSYIDAALAEYLMVFYTAVMLVLGLLVWLWYEAGRLRSPRPALRFQNGVAALFRASALILMLSGVAFILHLLDFIPGLRDVSDKDWARSLKFVYKISALRALAIVPFIFISPFRAVLDRIGDVLFYVLPEGDRQSTRAAILARVAAVASHVEARHDSFAVVAHSQGAVIARDGFDFSSDNVLTLGSPIDSLYHRFLGYRFAPLPGPVTDWTNLFRRDDVMAGPVEEAAENDELVDEGSGHEGYFSSPVVFARIGRVDPTGTGREEAVS